MKEFYVYFLTNWNNQVMYVGVTNNIERRIVEHKSGSVDGFSKRYNLSRLVYFEQTANVEAAIAREKQIKKKDFLVNQMNPEWKDLSADWYKQDPSASLGMTIHE